MSQWVLTYVPIAHCVLCPNDFVAVLMLNKYCWKIFVPMINSHMSQWRKKMTKSPNWDLSPDKRRTLKNKKMTKFCHWDSSSSDAISSGIAPTHTFCVFCVSSKDAILLRNRRGQVQKYRSIEV